MNESSAFSFNALVRELNYKEENSVFLFVFFYQSLLGEGAAFVGVFGLFVGVGILGGSLPALVGVFLTFCDSNAPFLARRSVKEAV